MSTIENAQQIVMASQYPMGPPGAPGADAGGPGLGAADVWRVLKQRKVLIIITFCLLYMGVIGGTFLTWRYAPLFSSEGYVKLVPPPRNPGDMAEPILPKDYILHQLGTAAAGMKDLNLLQEVLAQPVIKETKFYKSYRIAGDAGDESNVDFQECLFDLQKKVSAVPVRDTYLIKVSVALPDKSESQLLVETIVNRFLSRSKAMLGNVGRERVEQVKATRAELEGELARVRAQIANKRAERDMPSLESDRMVQAEGITMLSNTIAELKTRAADIEAQLLTVHGVDPRNLPLSAEMRVIIEADPVLRYYRQQVEQLDVQIEVSKRNNLGENHRQMKLLRDQRDLIFQQEAARREELIDDLRSRQVEQLQQEQARIRNMQATVREQLTERENLLRDLDRAIQELESLQMDEERLSDQLTTIGQQAIDAGTQLKIKGREGSLDWAMQPREAVRPSRPNLRLYLGGGFVLAALAAVGLAFLREFTDKAIRTPIDVTRYGHLSVLGCVPLLDDEEADVDEIELATRRAPHSLVAEAFRQVRAHLTFSGPLESQRTLLVTSPSPEDGKTAVAINLAVTFAQANERTLLIDCNFRQPGIRSAFPDSRPEGLSNVLVAHSPFDAVISRTDLPNLDLLTSGPMPPNPAELLGSTQMGELLKKAREKYDRIVLDGPPCLLISDALVVATQVDATVVVARAVQGAKGTLRRAREQLQRINARVIGAVLNGVQARPGGYFRQQYRDFYEYSDQEVVLRELPPGPTDAESDQDKPS
jgi:succinoglycan biosynthesis transport protein ExoP